MSDRTISVNALQGMLEQQTDEIYLECITITHPDLAATVYLVNDTTDLVRTAGTFIAWPFQMLLPNDDDAQVPQLTLTLDAIDRSISLAVQALGYPMPKITYEIVTAAAPNTVEAGPYPFDVLNITVNATAVQLVLGFEEDLLNEPFPGDLCTPSNAPGLFS